jgi:hypothetical protein
MTKKSRYLYGSSVALWRTRKNSLDSESLPWKDLPLKDKALYVLKVTAYLATILGVFLK